MLYFQTNIFIKNGKESCRISKKYSDKNILKSLHNDAIESNRSLDHMFNRDVLDVSLSEIVVNKTTNT